MMDIRLKTFIVLVIIICVMTLILIYSKIDNEIATKKEVVTFKGMIVTFIVYALVDFRLVFDDFYTFFPKLVVTIIMALGFSSMSFSCYFWFFYVSASAKIKAMSKRWWYYVTGIPLMFDLLFLYTPLCKFVYIVKSPPVFKPMLSVIMLMDYVYLIMATAISLYKKHKAKARLEKKKYGSQIIFILFFTLSGVLIGYLLGYPAIELVQMPVILKLYMDIQDYAIYADPMTGLSNRRRINEYLNEELLGCNQLNPIIIIMIDIDWFKNINDELGHDVGDQTLIAFSEALLKLTESSDAIAARWGGDEFVIAAKEKGIDIGFRKKLTDLLYEKKNEMVVIPRFSVGSYKCTSSNITVEQLLKKVDGNLYLDKKIQHSQGGNFFDYLEKVKESGTISKNNKK
jgi:diguanylate cyclase (GGDEF)-like protein